MLVLIIGENGSGKSFFLTLMALSVLDKNILANFTIKHPNFQYLQFDDFLNIDDNTDVFIDEAYTWLENRRSNKASNVYISEIKEQKRKTNSTWYVSEQRPHLLDKRFEQFPNVLVECKTRYPIGKSKDDFLYKLTFEENPIPIYKRFPYKEAKLYFQYFDTKEKVEPENKQLLEFYMIKDNPDKLFKKVLSLAKVIENNGLESYKFTHPTMKWKLLEKGIILNYEPYLYLYFKNKYDKLKKEEK